MLNFCQKMIHLLGSKHLLNFFLMLKIFRKMGCLQFSKFAQMLLYVLFFLGCSLDGFGQYVGSSQFFNLTGEWINTDANAQRINRIEILPTLVNTYRIRPYYALGKKELPGKLSKLEVSEKELAYVATLAQARCLIMPMDINGTKTLKIYSFIVDPSGTLDGIVIDYMVRKEPTETALQSKKPEKGKVKLLTKPQKPDTSTADTSNIAKAEVPSDSSAIAPQPQPQKQEKPKKQPTRTVFQSTELIGYWVNEWEEDQIIPRFQVMAVEDGSLMVRPYRIEGVKSKAIGEFKLIREETGAEHYTEWTIGATSSTMRFRPIIQEGKLVGIDMIIEEAYLNGKPKGIHRQFFVPDPYATEVAAAEQLIKALEGTWMNMDPSGATHKIHIHDGDIEVWVNDSEKDIQVTLGKKVMQRMGENLVGAVIVSMASTRTVVIDPNLEVNSSLLEPNIMVLNTQIDDIEGIKMSRMRSEVFKRKGTIISSTNYPTIEN